MGSNAPLKSLLGPLARHRMYNTTPWESPAALRMCRGHNQHLPPSRLRLLSTLQRSCQQPLAACSQQPRKWPLWRESLVQELSLFHEVPIFLGQPSEDISEASDTMKDKTPIPLRDMTLVEVHPGSDQSHQATRGHGQTSLGSSTSHCLDQMEEALVSCLSSVSNCCFPH